MNMTIWTVHKQGEPPTASNKVEANAINFHGNEFRLKFVSDKKPQIRPGQVIVEFQSDESQGAARSRFYELTLV